MNVTFLEATCQIGGCIDFEKFIYIYKGSYPYSHVSRNNNNSTFTHHWLSYHASLLYHTTFDRRSGVPMLIMLKEHCESSFFFFPSLVGKRLKKKKSKLRGDNRNESNQFFFFLKPVTHKKKKLNRSKSQYNLKARRNAARSSTIKIAVGRFSSHHKTLFYQGLDPMLDLCSCW